MKPCPWCGRNNLDSDEYCFNCERSLDAVPDQEYALELEEEIRRRRVYKPPSMLKLVLVSLAYKIVLAALAMGAFFAFVLVAIWVSYDNDVLALVALGILGVAMLCALYYPDIKASRRIGVKGILVSALANLIILCLSLPPVLWYLSRRGYIAGIGSFFSSYWWAFLAFLVVGCVVSWLSGRGSAAETARP
jgi:hypothetical protein